MKITNQTVFNLGTALIFTAATVITKDTDFLIFGLIFYFFFNPKD